MAKVLVLSDGILLGFARDKMLRTQIPELRRVFAAIKRGGGCRCRKRRGNLGAALAGLKSAISTNPTLAARLKSRTKSTQLVVHVRKGNKLVRRTI